MGTGNGAGGAPPLRAAVGALSGRSVEIDGVSLAFDDDGEGSPAVCLHAIGHGAGDFARLRRHLAGRHRVVALDWPGQGCSSGDHVPASAERYAELLGSFLNRVGLESVVLIGNSIGGAAAIRYAAEHPERVSALVLENPGGLAPTDDRLARVALATMAAFFAAGSRRAPWFPRAFAAYYRHVLRRRPAREQRRRIVASAYEIAPVLLEAWRGFARPEADLRELAPGVSCPVLFAWATSDSFVSLRRSLPSIRRFPQARVEEFRAGHAPHLETPDAFEAAVDRFLA